MAESKDSLDVDPVISVLPSQSSVSAVSVKLPPFWAAQPKVWFAQAEAQFVLRGIVTEETKYYYLVASLDQEAAKRVVDLISDPPSKGKYEMLKNRLLATFSLSPYRMAQLLLDTSPLGDRRPSQLMDDMLAFLGDHEPCILFRTLFVDSLPVELRPHLIPSLETLSPRDLALLADHLVSSHAGSISAVGKPQRRIRPDCSPTRQGWCRLHRKWGKKAFRCEPPCSFASSSKTSISAVQGNLEDGLQ